MEAKTCSTPGCWNVAMTGSAVCTEHAPKGCRLCLADPTPPNSAPRNCAFKNSISFDQDNWRCGSLERIRDLMYHDIGRADAMRFSARSYEDQSCGIVPFGGKWLVLGWYKDRGHVEAAFVLDETTMRPAAYADILEVLKENP